MSQLKSVGRDEPLSGEKLTTVLGWYEADGWEAGCERCIEMINYGGRGHSLMIHAEDQNVIMKFGLEKPVFRIAVNTMGTLGATGMTTGVMPSMTLGPGGYGGAITGDNVNVHQMYNIKRLAYEITPPPEAALRPGSTDDPSQHSRGRVTTTQDDYVEEIVRRVLSELKL